MPDLTMLPLERRLDMVQGNSGMRGWFQELAAAVDRLRDDVKRLEMGNADLRAQLKELEHEGVSAGAAGQGAANAAPAPASAAVIARFT